MNRVNDDQSKVVKRARRNTLGDILTRTAARVPNKQAFIFRNRQITYEGLDELVDEIAFGLVNEGIKKGDRLAILSKNSLDFVVVMFAIARIGAVFIPINYNLKNKDVAYILSHAEVSGVFASEEYTEVLDEAAKDINLTNHYRFLLETTTSVDSWKSLTQLPKQSYKQQEEIDISDDDLAQVLYTSGTESKPKGVMLSHKSIISEYVSSVIDGIMSDKDLLVHALPFYHSAQLHVFLGPSIYIGASGIILDEATPTAIMKTIAKFGGTQLFAPPTVWIAMLRDPDFDNFELTTLSKCYYGAAIMPREILKELSKRLPNALFWNFYGQTEVAPLATALQPEDQLRKLGSAGRATLQVETKIVDNEDNEVARGETGEIVHRTPHAMLGYLNDPEKTQEAFKNGWFHSGDLGEMDEEGYITIVDRKKDIINTGGVSVASREVEEVIYQLNEVSEVAVIGIKDDYWIEAITAVIVLKDNHQLTEKDVMSYCKKELSQFKSPKHVYFTYNLPKNPSGKVLKKDLRDQYEVL